jgi:flagellar protein FliJ
METPFRFGLERVREIRAHDEEQAKEQFADSLSQRVRGEAMLRAAEDRLREAQRSDGTGLAGAFGGPISGDALVARQAWVERLERTRDDAAVRLQGLDMALARSRESLTDASRRREVLDQLKRRHREKHVRECERRESNAIDEMALNVHNRRRSAA